MMEIRSLQMRHQAARETAYQDELIDLVYGALLGECSWNTFFNRLLEHKGDGWAVLVSHDNRDGEGMFGHYYGCDEALVSDYEGYFAGINPWAPNCVARSEGKTVIGNDLFPRDRFVQSEFFNDFLLPHDTRDGAGLTIVKNDSRSVMLSVLTADDDQDNLRLLSDRLAFLYPHLRRAADFYRRREGQEMTGFGEQLFEAIDVGVVVLGEGMRPKAVSDAAAALIDTCPDLAILATGRFHIRDEEARQEAAKMLQHQYSGEKSRSFQVGNLRLTLTRIEKDRLSWYFTGPTVVALIEPLGGMGRRFDPEGFAVRFDLTPAELRALVGVVGGKTYAQIAAEAGISLETVRTQVKRLYLKVGVNSQSGLLRLVHAPMALK
jgi:DNA-binding CsgD family transcriptional regulator